MAQAEDDLRVCRERFETLAQESAELKKSIAGKKDYETRRCTSMQYNILHFV
jgi:hypothetical protein